jgi:hypothetical protein
MGGTFSTQGRELGICRRRWEDNIRMDLREIGWKVVDCIHLAQDRDQWRAVVNTVTKFFNTINGGEFLELLSDYQLLNKGRFP